MRASANDRREGQQEAWLTAIRINQQEWQRRWQVELSLRWIKQHLRIKAFYGTSENAVKTQIWIAVSVYVLVAIVLQAVGPGGQSLPNATDSKRHAFRENAYFMALQALDEGVDFAENVHQLILFDL